MANPEEVNNLLTRAVFLTGMTDFGIELMQFYPNIQLSESIRHDLCIKSMPMACEDGDMLITHIGEYQAVCLTRLIPCFEENSFKEKTHATLGLLIPKDINPIPYYKILEKLLYELELIDGLTKDYLSLIVPKLYHSINSKLKQD
ncbi:MAG: hypothetical protein ACTSSG_08830 [Candidatus Heimdallarchaeaceae archaeon]